MYFRVCNRFSLLTNEENITVSSANYEITGKVSDEGSASDKIYVNIDGSFYPVKKGEFQISRFSPVDETVKVVAIDQWGNETEKIINVKVKIENKVVAKKLGRKYFGIERDKKYFKAAGERIKKTKVIEDEYLDTVENNKSKPRVPFGSLVELGILKPGTTLFDPKKKINAKIMADGSIKYKESEGSIHKVAATIMGAESYNGWTYWHCNINGSTVVIDSLRQKFISETKA